MFFIALVYLSAPIFIILFTFFSNPFVVMSACALTLLIFCLHKSWRKDRDAFRVGVDFKRYWLLLLVSGLIVWLATFSPLLPEHFDWYKHYAILNTLIHNTWPPTTEYGGETMLLRFYMGYYIIPSLLAKLISYQILPYAMFFWTWIGVSLTLLLAFQNLQKPWYILSAAALLFIFFNPDITGLIEDIANERGAILSNRIGITWVPHHAIAGWLGASLFLSNRHIAIRYVAIILVFVAIWSPFAAIGLIPFAVWALIKERVDLSFFLVVLAAILIAAPIFLYITQGASDIPFAYVWQLDGFSFFRLTIFLILKFLLLSCMLIYKNHDNRSLIIICCFFLAMMCFVSFGELNDLLMRGSIPIVALLAIVAIRKILDSTSSQLQKELLIFYLLIGAVPQMVLFVKSVSNARHENLSEVGFYHHEVLGQPDEKSSFQIRYGIDRSQVSQYLVPVNEAKQVIGVPVMRNLKNL